VSADTGRTARSSAGDQIKAPVPAAEQDATGRPASAIPINASAPSAELSTANVAATGIHSPAERWRVIVTAKANYFNLGGHVNRSGVVDRIASNHLRDALKSHRNFGQIPPEIRRHILTQNINLTKIAPYRALLGMDDVKLEQEQAVKFERVVNNH